MVNVTDEVLHDTFLPRVKQFPADAARFILAALRERFASTKLLKALSLAYPQHWKKEAELPPQQQLSDFEKKLKEIEAFYCTTQARVDGGAPTPSPLNSKSLRAQSLSFKVWARRISKELYEMLEEEREGTAIPGLIAEVGLATRFWRMLAAQQGFRDNCSEWVRLGELAVVIVPGSVEDERIFSAMNFLKSVNRSTPTSLMHSESLAATPTRSPYHEALQVWNEVKGRRGVDM